MNQEEIIKYLESYIQFYTVLKAPEPQDAKMMVAVKGLLDLYNKEKEKNALLLANNNGYYDLKEYLKNNYISKDKLIELKEIDNIDLIQCKLRKLLEE